MTISVTDTATGQELTVREVSAALALPPGVHVSAPYSRAVGILEGWARDERHAVDEFAAWIEGQWAQIDAELRMLCDELELPHVQAASVQWAELPDEAQVPGPVIRRELPGLTSGQHRNETGDATATAGRSVLPPDPVQAYYDADDSDDLPGRRATAWEHYQPQGPRCTATINNLIGSGYAMCDGRPGHEMPHRTADGMEWWPRAVMPRRNDVFDRPFVPDPADYGPWVNLAEDDLMPGRAVRVGRPTDDPMYARALVPLPHKKPTKNRLAQRRFKRGLRRFDDNGPYNPVVRRVDGGLERADTRLRQTRFGRWLAARFTPVKEEQ